MRLIAIILLSLVAGCTRSLGPGPVADAAPLRFAAPPRLAAPAPAATPPTVLDVITAHWLLQPATRLDGDLSGDGRVDMLDFALLAPPATRVQWWLEYDTNAIPWCVADPDDWLIFDARVTFRRNFRHLRTTHGCLWIRRSYLGELAAVQIAEIFVRFVP